MVTNQIKPIVKRYYEDALWKELQAQLSDLVDQKNKVEQEASELMHATLASEKEAAISEGVIAFLQGREPVIKVADTDTERRLLMRKKMIERAILFVQEQQRERVREIGVEMGRENKAAYAEIVRAQTIALMNTAKVVRQEVTFRERVCEFGALISTWPVMGFDCERLNANSIHSKIRRYLRELVEGGYFTLAEVEKLLADSGFKIKDGDYL